MNNSEDIEQRLIQSIEDLLSQESRTDLNTEEQALMYALKDQRVVSTIRQHAIRGESLLDTDIAWDIVNRRVSILFRFTNSVGSISLRGNYMLVTLAFGHDHSVVIEDPFELPVDAISSRNNKWFYYPKKIEDEYEVLPVATYKKTHYPTPYPCSVAPLDLAAAFPEILNLEQLRHAPLRFRAGKKTCWKDDEDRDNKIDV